MTPLRPRRAALRRLFAITLFALLTPVGAPTAFAEEAVSLTPCRLAGLRGVSAIRAECGSLTVPLDYNQPDGDTIDLAIARVPALRRSESPVAVTAIAGGPGQASIEFYASYGPAFRRMRESHDVILVDQRGTGGSMRLGCPAPDENLQGGWNEDDMRDAARDCLNGLPADPRFFTTSVAVRDLDAVRAALGYEQLSVYGISYGTRVAQHYLRRYPDQTHSVILDGVVPVDEALGPDIAPLAQRAVGRALARCADNDACNAAFPDIERRFEALIDQLREQPVTVTLNHPVTAAPTTLTVGQLEVAGAIRLLSYAPQTVALLPLMIHEASNGNYVPLAAQALTVSQVLADSMAFGMHNAVVCAEDAPFFGAIDREALAQTYLGTPVVDALSAACDLWPQGRMDDDFKTPFESDVPVLVLSGEADPITPPEYGERVVDYLGRARHILGPGQGHGQAAVGCFPMLMGQFVRDRDLDALDTSCVEQQIASPFFTSFAGPEP
ncbi:MAG: alpha/beta fold hydrolase [Pseudomonadota bacterium]